METTLINTIFVLHHYYRSRCRVWDFINHEYENEFDAIFL